MMMVLQATESLTLRYLYCEKQRSNSEQKKENLALAPSWVPAMSLFRFQESRSPKAPWKSELQRRISSPRGTLISKFLPLPTQNWKPKPMLVDSSPVEQWILRFQVSTQRRGKSVMPRAN